jgi:two-component system KDP operon response regulator KdpE
MSASLISSNAALRRQLRALLEPEGFHIWETASSTQAADQLRGQRFRLAILDLDSAGPARHDAVRTLKKASGVPLIALSGTRDDSDVVTALEHGADDYIVMPFNPDVMLARIYANLRMPRAAGRPAADPLENGPVRIDPERHEVRIAGRTVPFSPKEFGILCRLVRDKGEPVPNKDLLGEVWGEAHLKDDHYLRVYMSQLRKKLEPAGLHHAIAWVPGRGYRMEALDL